MKLSSIHLVIVLSLYLLILTMIIWIDILFFWMYLLTIIGQIFVVYLVYKVLTEPYKTDKTFDDFYEDEPIDKNEDV